MQKKQDAGIWERLRQRRILVLGSDSDMKQKFLRELGNRGAEISENAEDMSPEDYVILFGFTDRAFPAGGWEEFSSLTRILRQIGNVRPGSVLFVSRSDVYGKLFGDFHPVKEDELGYVCHTDMREQAAVRLRMLEHLCCRMAREDGIAVRTARVSGAETGKEPEQGTWEDGHPGTGRKRKTAEENKKTTDRDFCAERTEITSRDSEGVNCNGWGSTVELAVRVLLDGTAGEAYNIGETLQAVPDTTALEPIGIVMDTGKAGKLG